MTEGIPMNYKVNAAQVAQYAENPGPALYNGARSHTPLGTVAPSTPGSYPITFPRG